MLKMNTLITKRFNLQTFPQYFPPLSKKIQHHITPFPRKFPFIAKTQTLCSIATPNSFYNGWDEPRFIGESNQLHKFLNSLGINDEKYVFIYILGFICAFAISRIKVSSIIAIPGFAIVFALGFSFGVFNSSKKMNFLDKKSVRDQIFITVFVEKMRDLLDYFNGVDVEIGNLIKGVRKSIDCNEISVNDLQSFEKILESMNYSSVNARKVVEGCIESLSIEGQEMGRNYSQKSSKRKKEPGKYGFDLSQIATGLFQTQSESRSSKTNDGGESVVMDREMDGAKQGNILSSVSKERRLNSLFDVNVNGISGTSRNSFDDDAVRQEKLDETFRRGNRMNAVHDENANFSERDSTTDKSVFNREEYSYQTSRVQFMRNQRVSHRMGHPSEFESWASDGGLVDSMDFKVNAEQIKTEASFLSEKKIENLEEMSSHFGGKENDEETYGHFLREEMRSHEKEPSMVGDEASNEFEFGSSPPSIGSIDLQFNKYLTEADILVKEAKDRLRRQGSDRHAEDAFYKSAILLSKAIDVRPMSLLAVGQLGNTYLLHGELKLRISKDLRALLTDTLSVNKRTKIRDGLDDTVPRKDKMISYLVNVCEECEELLIKAGRQYRLALSIDGNDVRALYNWGLALSLRAQLIADIGPVAARDADKVFLAAIDKFDAMMSQGNVYAPDALFRWATALQHRSRLRPRTSREKVKLLQQAQRLYEDALHMDSNNLRAREALSSCLSELKYWYR